MTQINNLNQLKTAVKNEEPELLVSDLRLMRVLITKLPHTSQRQSSNKDSGMNQVLNLANGGAATILLSIGIDSLIKEMVDKGYYQEFHGSEWVQAVPTLVVKLQK